MPPCSRSRYRDPQCHHYPRRRRRRRGCRFRRRRCRSRRYLLSIGLIVSVVVDGSVVFFLYRRHLPLRDGRHVRCSVVFVVVVMIVVSSSSFAPSSSVCRRRFVVVFVGVDLLSFIRRTCLRVCVRLVSRSLFVVCGCVLFGRRSGLVGWCRWFVRRRATNFMTA